MLKRAVSSKEQSEIAQEIETLQQASVAAMGKSISGDVEKEHLDTELSKHSEIEKTSEVSDGIEVTFKSGRAYTVNANGNVTQKTPRIYSDEVKAALTEGKYVTYNGKPYRVLYDVNSGYDWIEIVSASTLEDVTLGYEDSTIIDTADGYDFTGSNAQFEKTRWSYNNAITKLNDIAQKYLTNLADRARCIGSNPTNPEDRKLDDIAYTVTDSDENNYVKKRGYNGLFKSGDNNVWKAINYETDVSEGGDYNKLRKKGMHTCYGQSNAVYWLASRFIDVTSDNQGTTYFNVYVVSSGRRTTTTLFRLPKYGSIVASTPTNGFRPVIRLKDSIKITGGSGTSGSPYTIGL